MSTDAKPGRRNLRHAGQVQRRVHAELAKKATREEVATKPSTIDDIHAGAVPLAATTAWQGLFDHGGLRSGQTVLIHGGSGGVGHFAVQFANIKGGGGHHHGPRRGRRLPARAGGRSGDRSYRTESFEDLVSGVDLVLDLIGGKIQDRSWPVLRKGGRLISTLGEPLQDKARQYGVTAVGFMAKPMSEQLTEMADLIDAGRVTVVVDHVLRPR